MTDDEVFAAYVTQIMAAKDRYAVVHLLSEFQEKAYLSGRHILIDRIRQELNNFDDRNHS